MAITKDLFVDDRDKFEIELIVAELNAKSLHAFVADLIFSWTSIIREKRDIPNIHIIADFEMNGTVRIKYQYDEDTAYFARNAAAMHRTSLSNYLRSIIHWLAEEHRTTGRVWIEDMEMGDVPVRRRK